MKQKKIVLEYALDATTQSIFRAFSTEIGLEDWFADKVEILGGTYTFYWSKSPHIATLVSRKENSYLRLKWIDSEDSYFEFKIFNNEMTNGKTLVITDFADEGELKDAADLWDNQIEKLKRSIGCAKK